MKTTWEVLPEKNYHCLNGTTRMCPQLTKAEVGADAVGAGRTLSFGNSGCP